MERVAIKNPNDHPHFIGSWMINPTSLCDNLINYFEANKSKQKTGRIISGINKETKDSVDISIQPKEIILDNNENLKQYFEELFKCHSDYIKQWPFIKTICLKYEVGSFNLQKYEPGAL